MHEFVCISNNVIYRTQKLCSATRGRFLDGRILQRMRQKWGMSSDWYLLCRRKHRTCNLGRIPRGPQTNDNLQIPYLAILRKFSPLSVYSRHSLGMDGELFYRSRNRRNPLSAICLQTDGQLFQYLLQNAKYFLTRCLYMSWIIMSWGAFHRKIVSLSLSFDSMVLCWS